MAITTINENDYIKDSRTVINDNFTELDTTKAPLNSPALTGTPTAPTPNPGDDSTKLATTEYVQEEIRTHANLPVGFEYFSPNPNIPQGSLPLFGGEYSRATYADLWAWVQEQSGYLKTESDWQDLATANNGNVPYYSSGDGSTTFRVPSLKCWIKGANGTVSEVGSYLAAGLPNITGALTPNDTTSTSVDIDFNGTGAVRATNASRLSGATGSSNWTCWAGFNIDASRSSSVYGNSTTVQPESIVGMWLVKAYGTIEDTGVIDEQQYIDDRIAALPNTFLPLTGGTMSGDIKWDGLSSSNKFYAGFTEGDGSRDIGWASTSQGAKIALRSADYDRGGTASVGEFIIIADNGTNEKNLCGRANGSLLWDGKEVERVNARGANYIRFESGLQICWEDLGGVNYNTQKNWNLPVPFKDTNYVVLASCRQLGFGSAMTISAQAGTTSQAWIQQWNSTSAGSLLIAVAIGYWK